MSKLKLDTKDLLSLNEATEALGIHRATLYRWMDSGRIVFATVGPHRFIPTSEVKRLKKRKG